MKNLVIGLVSGYDFAALQPFFDSLEATGYRGDVLLFYDQLKPETLAELQKRNVKLQRFRKVNLVHPIKGTQLKGDGRLGQGMALVQRLLQPLPASKSLLTSLGCRFYHVVNIRFLLTHEALRLGRLNDYDRLMLTDVRDVVFQRDPFDFDDGGKVTSFWEHPRINLDTDRNYRSWIAQAFGEAFAKKHGQQRISCCAITTGPREKLAKYFETFVRLLQANTTPEPFRFGMDSAIHNRIIWESLIPELQMKENLAGPVIHLGGLKREEVLLNTDGKLINQDGSLINVVHQYDRHKDVEQLLKKA